MKIYRATNDTCSSADDLVVVIDVLRAFTTAAYLFNAGVEEIILASEVAEAFSLRDRFRDCLIIGEVNGIKVPGFDVGNSPTEVLAYKSLPRRMIQRTTAGTQGVVRAIGAKTIITASLVNAAATARYIRNTSPDSVTLVQTGIFAGQDWGDEDAACADLIEGILLGQDVDQNGIVRRVQNSRSGLHYDGHDINFPPTDLEMALQIDKFNFVMQVERTADLLVMHRMNL